MKKETKIKNVLASLYHLGQLVKQNGAAPEKDLEKARILIQRAFDFHLFSIFQYDYLDKKLVPMYVYGDPFNLVDAVNFRLGKGATAWSLDRKKSLLIQDLNREGAEDRFFVNSFLSVPIIVNAQVVGVVVIGHFRKARYGEGDRYLMEMIGPYLSGLLLKPYLDLSSEPQNVKERASLS